MKLNHLDLQSADVPALVTFLVTHFELVPRTRLDSPKIAILDDGAGFTLVIQHRAEPAYPDGFHIGFIVDDPAAVRARRDAIAAAGVAIGPVEVDGRGTRCYLHAPGGLLVEISSPRLKE
ncbi:MAG TPA: VOC family protein [Kofleriaceae bacterium]|nr:VOC family protein [Kofleriaceae bacterium]